MIKVELHENNFGSVSASDQEQQRYCTFNLVLIGGNRSKVVLARYAQIELSFSSVIRPILLLNLLAPALKSPSNTNAPQHATAAKGIKKYLHKCKNVRRRVFMGKRGEPKPEKMQ